jgi:sulfate transport system permease protein
MKLSLRLLVCLYVGFLVGAPVVVVFHGAFASGLHGVVTALTSADTAAAIRLTVITAALAVPLNIVFGTAASLAIVRKPSRFSRVLNRLIDLPLSISPIIIGLTLELAYASNGWFGPALATLGWNIMFSWPGIVMASAVVSLPLVVREVVPLLHEIGDHQEMTAETLGASKAYVLRSITLPALRHAVIYGALLTFARVIGEYGAVLIVSGNIAQHTQTLTLNIAENFENYMPQAGFAGAGLLASLSLFTMAALSLLRRTSRTPYAH